MIHDKIGICWHGDHMTILDSITQTTHFHGNEYVKRVEIVFSSTKVILMIMENITITRKTRKPAFGGYPRLPMITQTIDSYLIPSQNKTISKKLQN